MQRVPVRLPWRPVVEYLQRENVGVPLVQHVAAHLVAESAIAAAVVAAAGAARLHAVLAEAVRPGLVAPDVQPVALAA